MLDWVASAEFDALLVETVRATYPAHEQEQFLAHFRGLLGLVGAGARAGSLQTVISAGASDICSRGPIAGRGSRQ